MVVVMCCECPEVDSVGAHRSPGLKTVHDGPSMAWRKDMKAQLVEFSAWMELDCEIGVHEAFQCDGRHHVAGSLSQWRPCIRNISTL